MPDNEQLGILCLLGLLGVLYFIGLAIRFVVVYWYAVVPALATLVTLRVWWRRRHLTHLDEEDDEWEPVPQE